MSNWIAIADAKTEINAKDKHGMYVYIVSLEQSETLGYYGLREDGETIRNPDYAVDAPYIDD